MPKYICDKCKAEFNGEFCPKCGDKRTKKDEERMTDKDIIVDMLDDTKKFVSKKVKTTSKEIIIGIILLILSITFFFFGMYHKNSYYNDENGQKNVNAYVGGDAYNFIINSNYFSGYMSLSGAFLISSVLVFISIKKRD